MLLLFPFFCLSAHDNDVKEANKQRGQSAPQSAPLTVFQAAQPSRPVPFQQPQYLPQTSVQYRHPESEQPSRFIILDTSNT